MSKTLTLSSFLLSFLALHGAHHKPGEMKAIFDGKTLDGWTQLNGSATYRVEKGAIIEFRCANSLEHPRIDGKGKSPRIQERPS